MSDSSGESRTWRVTPIGFVVLGAMIAGLVLIFLGSHGASAFGVVLFVVSVIILVAGQMPANVLSARRMSSQDLRDEMNGDDDPRS